MLDASGQEIAVLIVGTKAANFDPRGLFFPDDQTLLIGASDPIYLVAPHDFQAPTPEPVTLLLPANGILGLWFKRPR